ncbi:MAG TPA: hypothetical protein VGE43_08595, partial [Acidimicrobiales bacterium]
MTRRWSKSYSCAVHCPGTILTGMNPLSRRASRAAAAAALSLVPASLLLVPIPDAVAVESTATVNFSDCEVHDRPYTIDQQVGGDTNWSPTVRLDHPSPLPSGDEVTVEAELGVLPAGTMPTSMTDLYLDVELEFTHTVPGPGPLRVFHSDFYFASFDKDAPLVIPEIEYQMSWSDPGLYDLRPKRVWLLFTAQDLGGNWVEYSFECDQVVNPQPLVTVPVYDLSATPELTLDRFTAQAGQSVGFAGRNLLAAAPMSPRVRATVTIAGNPAGTVEVDDSGAVHGNLSVPAGLSGTVEVRVTNGAKSAAAMLELSPPPGGGGVVGGVDVNNPATWHVNA